MKLFKSRGFAVLLTVVVVIATILINTNVKFGRKCTEVSDLFFDGVDGKTSIGTLLKDVSASADSLVTIAGNYGVDVTDVTDHNEMLVFDLRYWDGYAFYLFSDYRSLSSALAGLIDQLERADLSEKDAASVALAKSTLSSISDELGEAGYNEAVREFLRKYDHFPTNLLATLSGVQMPTYFS